MKYWLENKNIVLSYDWISEMLSELRINAEWIQISKEQILTRSQMDAEWTWGLLLGSSLVLDCVQSVLYR